MVERSAKKENLTSKTMATIEFMSREGRAVPLQVIADTLALPGATAYRILSSLREAGYVDQAENKDYYLTYKLLTTSGRIMERDRFMEQMLPYLNYFSLTTPCGVSLATYCEDACINLASISKSIKLRAQLVVPGTAHPCHCTAAGKLFLASLPPEELEGWLQRNPLLPYTTRTIIHPERLREDLQRTRERGYGLSDGEYADSVSVVAVPVPRARNAPPTALNFSIESKDFSQINNPEFIRSVRTMLNEKKVI